MIQYGDTTKATVAGVHGYSVGESIIVRLKYPTLRESLRELWLHCTHPVVWAMAESTSSTFTMRTRRPTVREWLAGLWRILNDGRPINPWASENRRQRKALARWKDARIPRSCNLDKRQA